jgi:hypothetical protein
MRRGSANVTQWYCAACAWSELAVLGKPGELSAEEARAAFEKHLCGEKSRKRKTTSRSKQAMGKAREK